MESAQGSLGKGKEIQSFFFWQRLNHKSDSLLKTLHKCNSLSNSLFCFCKQSLSLHQKNPLVSQFQDVDYLYGKGSNVYNFLQKGY